MKSRLADINQPLVVDPAAREAEKQIRREIADHRRQTIKGRDPRSAGAAAWKMRDPRPGPNAERPTAPSIWRFEFNEQNTVCRLTQVSPLPKPSMDSHEKWIGRKFRVRVTEACGGPESCSLAAGAILECFAELAFDLCAVGRAEILEEFADSATA